MPLIPGGSSSKPTLTAPGGAGGRQYTLSQLIAAQEAAKQEKDRSFLGKVFHGGKGGVVFGLRQILRPSIAVTSGIYRGIEGEDSFDIGDALHGTREGFMLRDKKHGKDILTELGWAGGGKWKSLAGFGVDVMTDPTLPLQIGATIATGGAAAPALLAGRAAIAGFAKAGANAELRLQAARQATKVLSEAGEGFSQRKTLSLVQQAVLRKKMKNEQLNEQEEYMLNLARSAAEAEETAQLALRTALEGENATQRVLQMSYNIPFSRGKRVPLSIPMLGGKKVSAFGETVIEGGKRIAPVAPSLLRTAQGMGVASKVPGVRQTALGLGKTFKHGFMEEEWAKPLLMSAHIGEKLYDGNFRVAHNRLGKHLDALSPESQRKALSWAQKRLTLVTRSPTGKGTLHMAELNGGIDAGRITAAEGEFIKDWHEYWEYIAERERIFGVRYDEQLGNKIYVPHIYQRNGGQIDSSAVSKAGFQNKRLNDLTVEEMHLASQSQIGKARQWVSDPRHITAIRSRRGAQAQAKELLLSHMRRSAGLPSRVPDVAKYERMVAKLKKEEARFAKYKWTTNTRLVGARKAKITNAAKKSLDAKRAKIDAEFAVKYAGVRKALERNLIDDKRAIKDAEEFQRQHKNALARAEKLSKDKQLKALEALDAEVANGWKQLAWADEKTRRYNRRLENGFTKRNPNIPPGWQKLSRKIDGEQHHFSPELHEAMTRVEKTFRDEADMEKIIGAWDRATAKWKIGVTSVNPGYRVRNTLSDIWNMYIAGVPTWAIPVYAAQAAKFQTTVARIERKVAENNGLYRPTAAERKVLNQLIEVHSQGIMSGLFFGDVQLVARQLAQGNKAKDAFVTGHFIRSFTTAMGTMNRHGENWGRLIHYLYRRNYEKLGASDAAAWVKRAHFDYTELTAVEKEKFKKVMPFYTWTRKNIPYQLVQMASRPGKYATFPKAVNMFQDMAEDEHGPMEQPGLMPEWMEERMAFQIPFFGENTMSLPMIGVTDLMKADPSRGVKELAQDWMGMVTPGFKIPVEIASGRSMLTGQELDDGRLAPVSDTAAAVLGQVGVETGTTSRMVRGERVEGAGANPWVKYVAGQIPMTNFLVNQQASINQAKRGSGGLTVLGYVGGFPIFDRDLEAEQTAALIENQEKVRRVIKGLRSRGVIPQAESARSKFEKQILLPSLTGG